MDNLQEDCLIEHLAADQARFCSLFSNARRVQILWALMDRELSVGAIAEVVGSSLQNVSQHLSIMRVHDLVTSRREGQTIYYRIKSDSVENHCQGLLRARYPEASITTHIDDKT